MAGYNTAWNRTGVCSDASSTEMLCLRPLCHLGAKLINCISPPPIELQALGGVGRPHGHGFRDRVRAGYEHPWYL
jgi:hypothetical protein